MKLSGVRSTATCAPVPGLAVRKAAVAALGAVLDRRRPLDEALATVLAGPAAAAWHPSDAALVHRLVSTALRRLGSAQALLASLMPRPLGTEARATHLGLVLGIVQLVFLDAPPHAVIDLAVRLAKSGRHGDRHAGLVNAVLRRVAAEGPARLAGLDAPALDTPGWLAARWRASYGAEIAARIMEAHLSEAPLDLSVIGDAAEWAERLGGRVLAAGSVRLLPKGRIEQLDGYDDGCWWVQDAAAALPVLLLGDVRGLHVADLCAAPGGKTAQLAAGGAHVVAVDRTGRRLARLAQNLKRLKLEARLFEADVTVWQPGQLFDAALLDAPCLATGTIRRHPDIPHLKAASDLETLVPLQARLLEAAARLVKPGGLLVTCTCSLEPEEGPAQIGRFLAGRRDFEAVPIRPGEAAIDPAWINPDGHLRTLPFHTPGGAGDWTGMDGFFACRLRRSTG